MQVCARVKFLFLSYSSLDCLFVFDCFCSHTALSGIADHGHASTFQILALLRWSCWVWALDRGSTGTFIVLNAISASRMVKICASSISDSWVWPMFILIYTHAFATNTFLVLGYLNKSICHKPNATWQFYENLCMWRSGPCIREKSERVWVLDLYGWLGLSGWTGCLQ